MRNSVKLVMAKGISIYLHFTLILFLLWIAVVFFATGMQWMTLLWATLLVVAIFLSILLHEYGHALVASEYGIYAKHLKLYPIGGIASIERLPKNPKQELLISSAGPFVSFCIAGLLSLFYPQKISWDSFTTLAPAISKQNFLYYLGVANLGLALINLIPAFPLDGGRILRALLALRYNYIRATAITASIGKIAGVLLIVAGFVTLSFILPLAGIFVLLFAPAEESYLKLKDLVKGMQLREMLMYDYDQLEAGLTVNEAANILQYKHGKYFIVMENGSPVGTLNRIEVMKSVADRDFGKKISELMKVNIVRLEGDMAVENILDRLAGNEDRIYPVFDHNRFIGVINFRHVIEYLLLHNASSKDSDKTRSLVELV